MSNQLVSLLSPLRFLPVSSCESIRSLLGGCIDIFRPVEQDLSDLESAGNIAIISNGGKNAAASLGILADVFEHVVVEQEVDDLQFANFGDH